MVNNKMEYTRQDRIFNPENQKSKIHILGCGSTGSFICLNLAKMGFENIKIYDFDKVEEVNIPNQFFKRGDIGKQKVEAMETIIYDFTGIGVNGINAKVDGNTKFDLSIDDIFILCFDNIESRRIVYNLIKDYPIRMIDTRMGGEGYQIYTIDLSEDREREEYEKRLEDKTFEAPCGQKSIIYTILSLASETCNIVKKIDCRENYPKVIKREMKTYNIINDN